MSDWAFVDRQGAFSGHYYGNTLEGIREKLRAEIDMLRVARQNLRREVGQLEREARQARQHVERISITPGKTTVLLDHDDIVCEAVTVEALLSGVYFLVLKDTVNYVGKANNVGRRIAEHVRLKEYPFDRIMAVQCPNEGLTDLERAYIGKFLPAFNAAHVPGGRRGRVQRRQSSR